MRSGFAAGRQDQAQGDEAAVPHLRPLNLNAWGELSISETKSVPASRVKEDDYLEQGEVLFNNTNSAEWVGKSTVFDLDTPCACSNHMTRISLNAGVEPHFVAALLNAFRGIGYFSALSTFFNNQAGINTSTLAALRMAFAFFALKNTGKQLAAFARWIMSNRIDRLGPASTTRGLGYHYHLGRTQAVDAASLVEVFESVLSARRREVFVSMEFGNLTDAVYKAIEAAIAQVNKDHALQQADLALKATFQHQQR